MHNRWAEGNQGSGIALPGLENSLGNGLGSVEIPILLHEEGPRRESLGSGRGLLEEERRGTQTGHSYLGGCSDFHIFPSLQVCWGMSEMKGRVMSSAVFISALPFPLIFRESLWL